MSALVERYVEIAAALKRVGGLMIREDKRLGNVLVAVGLQTS